MNQEQPNKKMPEKSSFIHKFHMYFFDTSVEPRIRLFNIIVFNIMAGAIVTMIPTVANHGRGIWLNILLFVTALFCQILNHKFHKSDIAGLIIALVSVVVVLPLMYVTQGGMCSAMPIWFVVCGLAAFLIVEEKYKFFMLFIGMAISVICLFFEYRFPDHITKLDGDFNTFIDILVGITGATLILLVIFIMHLDTEKHQRMILEEQQRELLAKKEELEYALNNDSLTGIYNRYSYAEYVKQLDEEGIPENLIAIACDVNELKRINDNFGHIAGDELLKAAAQIMTKTFEPYGKVFRIGGDEFQAIIRSDLSIDELKESFLRNMRSWIGTYVTEINISVGFADNRQLHVSNYAELQRTSDRNMYDDKSNFYKQRGIDRRHG